MSSGKYRLFKDHLSLVVLDYNQNILFNLVIIA